MGKIEEILEERSIYGDFEVNSVLVQQMKQALREHRDWNFLEPSEREAIEMIIHKIGRLVGRSGPSCIVDTVNDICGYAQLILKSKDL